MGERNRRQEGRGRVSWTGAALGVGALAVAARLSLRWMHMTWPTIVSVIVIAFASGQLGTLVMSGRVSTKAALLGAFAVLGAGTLGLWIAFRARGWPALPARALVLMLGTQAALLGLGWLAVRAMDGSEPRGRPTGVTPPPSEPAGHPR